MRFRAVTERTHIAAVAAFTLITCASLPAFADDPAPPAGLRLYVPATTEKPASDLSVFSSSSLAIGYPGSNGLTFGVAPLSGRGQGGLSISSASDFSAKYSTNFLGGDVGFFADYADQPSILTLAPATSWNFGASVGYAGFYVRGGISDTASLGPLIGREGWEAGLGYEIGALDLRLTFAESQAESALGKMEHSIGSQQWTLGGIYRLSSRLRLNADAFYGPRDNPALLAPAPVATPPQGTGARVGIQLRF